MQISFPMSMPASIQATAAALPDIKKGGTVAIQVDTRKWFLGTVTSKGSKKIAVDTFDGVYTIAAEDVDDVVRNVDLSAMKAAEVKRAMKATYTATQLKALTPKAAPKAPKVTTSKPVRGATQRRDKARAALIAGNTTSRDYSSTGWYVVNTEADIIVRGPFRSETAANKGIDDDSEEAIKGADAKANNLEMVVPAVAAKLAPAPKTKKVPGHQLPGIKAFDRLNSINPMWNIYKKIFGARPPHAGEEFKVQDTNGKITAVVTHMVSNHVMVVDTELRRNVEFVFVRDVGVFGNDQYEAIPAQYQKLVSKPRAKTSMPTTPSRNVSAKPAAPRIVDAYTYRDKYGETELTDAALPADITDPAIYKQTFYGRVVSTGRASSHLSEVVIVGTGSFKGKTAWVAFPVRDKTDRPRLLYYPIHAPKPEWLTKPQVSLEDLKRYRLRSQQKTEVLNERKEKKANIGAQVAQTMELRVGYKALIKFSNGDFWKEILQVDHNKQVIYIQGSRSKRRTIPFALIQQTAQK